MNSFEGDGQARSTADAVARRSYGKLVAFLAARTRDVGAAEDALSEAFAAALADWPREWLSFESGSVAVDRRAAKDYRSVARGRRRDEIAGAELQIMTEASGCCERAERRFPINGWR